MPIDHATKIFVEQLRTACLGIVFVSETDAPVEPVAFRDRDELRRSMKSDAREIEIANASEFFDRLTKTHAWHGGAEHARTRRFANLRDLLEEGLTDLKVYRIGKIRVEIFVLGETKSGAIAGIRTRAVET